MNLVIHSFIHSLIHSTDEGLETEPSRVLSAAGWSRGNSNRWTGRCLQQFQTGARSRKENCRGHQAVAHCNLTSAPHSTERGRADRPTRAFKHHPKVNRIFFVFRSGLLGYNLLNNKIQYSALAGVAQWIEHQPANQSVTGLIPSQGTCLGCRPGPSWGCTRGKHTLMFLSLSFSLPSPLSKNK